MPNPFSIFKTTHYTFDDKKSYENVSLLLYRHWFVLFGRLILMLILLILPMVLYVVFSNYLSFLNNIFWFVYLIYLLVWWHSLFYILTMYLLDIWIVTDHRVIDSEQHGFFNRTVSELSLFRIQDISTVVAGPISTFLDFGDVEIQTAGTEPKFIFKQVPHPVQVKDEIMRAHNQFMSSHPGETEIHEPV